MTKAPTLMLALAPLALVAGSQATALAQSALIDGQVTKVDPSAGKITIKHGPIKKLGMDVGMTMVFRAQEPGMLKAVRAGDRVKFDAEEVNGQSTVTKIENASERFIGAVQPHRDLHHDNRTFRLRPRGRRRNAAPRRRCCSRTRISFVRRRRWARPGHEAPTEILLRFNEKLEPKFSSIVVRDPLAGKADRQVRRAGRQVRPPADARVAAAADALASTRSSGGDVRGHLQGQRQLLVHGRRVAP